MARSSPGSGLRTLPQPARYAMALLLAPILGAIFPMLAGLAINAVFGKAVIGSDVTLSPPNVILFLLTGFYTGFLAALFAGQRGLLMAGLANWLPIILIAALAIMLGRDLASSHSFAALRDVAWVEFVPALAGGYFGAPRTRSERRPRRSRIDAKIADVFD